MNSPKDVFQHINMHGGDKSVCWEWKRGLSNGRPYIRVNGKKYAAYAVAFCAFHGIDLTAIAGWLFRHDCDNPSCCNPHHLRIGTHQQNMDDMSKRGRAGLSSTSVEHIHRLVQERRSDSDIAQIIGCSREAVRDIRTGRRRSNLEIEGKEK